MQINVIIRVFLLAVLMLFAVLITFQTFTMGGNVLGNSFRFLTPLAIVIGLAASRWVFYLLLFAGAYLDLVKRFMVLDSRFSDTDLAFLLGFAPALVAGMVLKFVALVITKSPDVSGREVKLFVGTTLLCLFLGAAQILMADGLRSAGNALNMVTYLYMPLLVPRIFRSIPELKQLMLVTVVIYLPAALWAIHQAYFGIADFEMEYLRSGMTIEIRQLDEVVFRNMGTMVSAHALSMVASILAIALIIPISWKSGRIRLRVWLNPIRLICISLFIVGAYFTFSRTGWVCGVIALLAFVCLQSRFLTFTAFFSTIIAITALYLSADTLLKSRVAVESQEILFEKFGTSAEARQAMVLGTLDARLESMASFTSDASIWTPFGMKVAKKEVQLNWVHDILTENLIRFGYVPLGIFVVVFLAAAFNSFRLLFRIPKGPHRTLISYYSALAIGIMSGGFSQGIMILYFPINLFWCLFLGVCYSLYLMKKFQPEEEPEVELPPRPVSPAPAGRRNSGPRRAIV